MTTETILTPEQVEDLRIESFIKRQDGNVVRLSKLADSHEALREQLVGLDSALVYVKTEWEMEQAYRKDIQVQLAEARSKHDEAEASLTHTQHEAELLVIRLAEARADVQELMVIAKQGAQIAHAWVCRANNFAEPLDDYRNCGSPGCKGRTAVLARPGVKRLMEKA